MNPDPAPAGDPMVPARHSLERPMAAVPDPTPLRPAVDRPAERPGAAGQDGSWFAVVLRGYDRAQVDARLSELDRTLRDEIVRADTAEAGLSAARAHVRRLQETVAPTASEDRGFGLRVERVLNAAEREATELRERAAEEAAALVEQARADADRARRQTEEALLGRAAKLDAEFTARSAGLDAREQEVDRIVERARREADEIRAAAERAAAEESGAAERRAAEVLRQAERTIEQQRADATRDIGRMAALRDEVRQELSRLHGLLRGELDDPITAATPETDAADRRDPSPFARSQHDDGDPNVRTAIGTIPPYTVSSIGVLPFGDRSAGGPASGRSFAFELVPDGSGGSHDDDGEPRTSDDISRDGSARDRTPTRSTTPSGGHR